MSTGSTNNVMVVLIAAHNEEACIVGTLQSLLTQHRKADRIVVAADNCTDRTFALASAVPGVIAFETEGNTAKKPGALNQAWRQYAKGADLVVSMDADTTLDPTALAEWEREFRENPKLGGCSAKFTMLVADHMSPFERLLVRLQRAEFARWTDLALKRHR
jgi:cellulose synthase/poly-beta-1,6-N-acetylglucosamine synthase-like glycosyltransferase